LILFISLLSRPEAERVYVVALYQWISSGAFAADIALRVDILSATVGLIISFVAFMIHIYSIGYMRGDEGKYRFFAYMNLFTAAMFLLVLADNLLAMFIGWEGVGFCSYILIGFWFHKDSAADAGKKAFIVTRLGDAGFVLGILAVYYTFGTFEIGKVMQAVRENAMITPWFAASPGPAREVLAAATPIFGASLATVITFLFLSGAVGKSAQIPLYVWLPDAMEGPTPVSALIHAATMVTAGVYLIARWNFLFVLAPVTLETIAIIGAVTALFAATMAMTQYDIKRVLAYSTISQIGYMFLALGVACFSGAIFHFMTHAFFKALLFLGAGSVMHCLAGELDMRKMGALRRVMPVTFATFLIAALSIGGIPGLAGFFSKDEIIWQSMNPENGLPPELRSFLWGLSVLTAALTAFYIFRVVFLTFFGDAPHSSLISHPSSLIHDPPRVMTWPMVVLALFSIVAGYVSMPHIFGGGSWFSGFIGRGIFDRTAAGISAPELPKGALLRGEWFSTAVCAGLAVAAILFAYLIYVRRPRLSEEMEEGAEPVFRVVHNKYYVDEAYRATFVRACFGLARLFLLADKYIVDGLALGIGWCAQRTGRALRRFQDGDAQSYAVVMAVGILILVAAFFWFI
jgi:NADH-quinone oxidoreductase subunit L